jgi:hypothetical protein
MDGFAHTLAWTCADSPDESSELCPVSHTSRTRSDTVGRGKIGGNPEPRRARFLDVAASRPRHVAAAGAVAPQTYPRARRDFTTSDRRALATGAGEAQRKHGPVVRECEVRPLQPGLFGVGRSRPMSQTSGNGRPAAGSGSLRERALTVTPFSTTPIAHSLRLSIQSWHQTERRPLILGGEKGPVKLIESSVRS